MSTKKNRWPLIVLLAGAVAFVGCGDDDSGDDGATPGTSAADASGDADSGDTATPGTDADSGSGDDSGGAVGPTFTADVAPIILANCSCHQSEAGPNGLIMTADVAYASLVGPDATVGLPYVTPSDSGASYVVNKLDGTHIEAGGDGAMMPLGGALTPDDLATFIAWIDAGAVE